MVKRSFGYDPSITFGKGAKYMIVFSLSLKYSAMVDAHYIWGCFIGAILTGILNWLKNQDKITIIQIKQFFKDL